MIQLGDSRNKEPSQDSYSFFIRHKRLLLGLVIFLTIGSCIPLYGATWNGINANGLGKLQNFDCGKVEPLIPAFNKSIESILHDPEFKREAIERFAGAIKIPTEVQDGNPAPSDDPDYYLQFSVFHEYLAKTYPLIHEHLEVEKVNKFGLLYTWKGSNKNLKPLVLMAHQDVVPVNRRTWDDWEYPPYSGYYDAESDTIWGRGAADCKNLLIGELEAIELLIRDGYFPERTTIVSLGFDEESGGRYGAQYLAEALVQKYGYDGIYAIVDEGNNVIPLEDGVFIASVVNGEKGYVDIIFTVSGQGGHSSAPPDHTTIGVAADLISKLENNPFESQFGLDSPIYGLLTCVAKHSNTIPSSLKKDILEAPKSSKSREHLAKLLASDASYRDLIRTTRAVDVINGGIKANALPEVTSFLVNHRIDIHSSVEETVNADLKYVKNVAKKYGYGVSYNGKHLLPETKLGIIEVTTNRELEPSPVSPSSGPTWDTFAGTIQNVFENGVFAEKKDIQFYISTYLMTPNTDTRWYWDLSKNIYRFTSSIADDTMIKTVHSVNEHIKTDDHLSVIAFMYQYIVNTGTAK